MDETFTPSHTQSTPEILYPELSFKVTEDIYFGFQRISKDFNPLHTDEAFAIKHGFQTKVMYGNILNAFISYFVGMTLPSREVIIQSQDISFHKPVYLNDVIKLKTSVENYSDAVKSVSYKLTFYKPTDNDMDMLVAKGHVMVGLL